jgi:trans-aconitate 2-methyltransferase
MWDAAEYEKFADQRSRPFFDLTARVRADRPARVADLGCGPGALTETLSDRWPDAVVVGVDNSAEMLARAAPLTRPGRLEFVRADLADWAPPGPLDVLVSNAALHWVGDHPGLLARLADMIAPGGCLAVQMPDRFAGPSQEAIEETVADPCWADRLRGVGLNRRSVLPLTEYVERLSDLGLAVDAWATTYIHPLTGDNPVADWLAGTGLRPLLARLDPDEATAFRRALGDRLRAAYPPRNGVTLFPMPRLFFVATRPD